MYAFLRILWYHHCAMGKRVQQGQTKKKGLKKRKRNRSFGFRARMQTPAGKRTISRRRAKGRKQLTITHETGSSAEKNKKLSRRR